MVFKFHNCKALDHNLTGKMSMLMHAQLMLCHKSTFQGVLSINIFLTFFSRNKIYIHLLIIVISTSYPRAHVPNDVVKQGFTLLTALNS